METTFDCDFSFIKNDLGFTQSQYDLKALEQNWIQTQCIKLGKNDKIILPICAAHLK